jgi:hypothetical protein
MKYEPRLVLNQNKIPLNKLKQLIKKHFILNDKINKYVSRLLSDVIIKKRIMRNCR